MRTWQPLVLNNDLLMVCYLVRDHLIMVLNNFWESICNIVVFMMNKWVLNDKYIIIHELFMLYKSPYVLSMVMVILVYGHCNSSGVCLCVTWAVSCLKRCGWPRHGRA